MIRDYGNGCCPWCGGGGRGGHDPKCQVFSDNWKNSLDTQREVTRLLRKELGQETQPTNTVRAQRFTPYSVEEPPPEDKRTEVQKRFDAIAEEIAGGD